MEKKKKERVEGRSLVDLAFSWSLGDVLNADLYKGQVKKIPNTFPSVLDYTKSFVPPLIVETHAELLAGVTALSQAPICEISCVEVSKDYKPPRDLYYKIWLRGVNDNGNDGGRYKPENGDLVALTDVWPKHIDDLDRPTRPYTIALVCGFDPENFSTLILSSRPIVFEEDKQAHREDNTIRGGKKMGKNLSLFGVYLANMTTNIRIWKALHPDPEGTTLNLIGRVIRSNFEDEDSCTCCFLDGNDGVVGPDISHIIRSSKLNDSQEGAIRSCLKSRQCCHKNTVKLIWGPPGTGKTKTVGVLLYALLKMRCRTVTCAPTNTAVLEVASRLVRLALESSRYSSYGLGDIVLIGNAERMKIDDRDDLLGVFLDHRVEILFQCFKPLSGWRGTIRSLIDLLKDPEGQYRRYLESRNQTSDGEGKDGDLKKQNNAITKSEDNKQEDKENLVTRVLKQFVAQALFVKERVFVENEGEKKQNAAEEAHLKREDKQDEAGSQQKESTKEATREEEKQPLSFKEFLKEKFNLLCNKLEVYVLNLYTHLPTSLLSFEMVEEMTRTIDMLRDSEFASLVVGSGFAHFVKRRSKTKDCVEVLNSLPQTFGLPDFVDEYSIRKFCLENVCLLFCTASCCAKLQTTKTPTDLLIVDEAAQLKECESTIPLQLPGLCHAVLIGDERQLPAMVRSKIAVEAEFGRSLFERLVMLGQKKHLLNIQYRMHPAISLFPNKEFYDMKILDAQSVRLRSYCKRFLPGDMYGPYSFINVTRGREQFGEGHSLKNMVEVAVVSEIVASLFRASKETVTRISVGVISPYKAQVFAIQDKIGNKYSNDAGGLFSLNVRSADGFQGGEEDIVIMSTVRCNGNGSIGFLSNRQRANVALTRARYCLWILGNEATLVNSNSIWRKLIIDSKKRGCFYNADEDKSLAQTVCNALLEVEQLNKLLNKHHLSFRGAKWKVCLSNEFQRSLAKIMDPRIHREILSFLERVSCGWRQQLNERSIIALNGTRSQFLEQYPIDDVHSLVWAVDILKESSHYIQVLKVWDILPSSEVPKLAKRLDKVYGKYTKKKVERCLIQSMEGNCVVPKKWPVDPSDGFYGNVMEDGDPANDLSKPLASLNLKDK